MYERENKNPIRDMAQNETREKVRDKARDETRDWTHKSEGENTTHKRSNDTRQDIYTGLLLAQYTTVYPDLQYREKKRVDLLHSNENGNPTSERENKRRNVWDPRQKIRQEMQ